MMKKENDPFKTTKPLYDRSIDFDTTHLPSELRIIIMQLEEYDREGDWFYYDILFDQLEITGKIYLRDGEISEKDYEMLLKQYGGVYD